MGDDEQELKRTNEQLAANSWQSAEHRTEAREEFIQALRDRPVQVEEQCKWILNGDYGRGAQIMGSVMLERRLDPLALLGMLEFNCPAKDAHDIAIKFRFGIL